MSKPASTVIRALLAISLLGNVALATWLIQTHRRAGDSPTTTVSGRELQAPTSTTGSAVLRADLVPYAAIGTFLSENNHIPDLKWNREQFAAFQQGVQASYEGRGYALDEPAVRLRDEISAKVQAMLDSKQSDPVEDYFKTLREKENVQRTSTGLHYRITQEGSGNKPGPDSTVVASYAARLPGGQAIPSLTRARARSAVRDLLPGLGEGVQLLNPGGKALVYLSPALSFRDGQWPTDVPKGAPIIFFLELHAVE